MSSKAWLAIFVFVAVIAASYRFFRASEKNDSATPIVETTNKLIENTGESKPGDVSPTSPQSAAVGLPGPRLDRNDGPLSAPSPSNGDISSTPPGVPSGGHPGEHWDTSDYIPPPPAQHNYAPNDGGSDPSNPVPMFDSASPGSLPPGNGIDQFPADDYVENRAGGYDGSDEL